jgi:DNA (cytosine-5)-methyltransferase 1
MYSLQDALRYAHRLICPLEPGFLAAPFDYSGFTHKHSVLQEQPVAWSGELTASTDIAGTLQRGGEGGRIDGVMTPQMAVRRLTPRECERLQGFPDDYTLVEYRGKSASDGPRYKALGNSMAVPVMRWIGERIAAVDAILRDGSGTGSIS